MNLATCLVRDYMTRTVVTFKPGMDVLDAVHELVNHHISGAPVVDDQGNLLGMLSEADCMRVALNAGYHETLGGPVSEFMSHETRTVSGEMNIVDLAQDFIESGFRRFPVIDGTRLIGQISRHDVLRALQQLAKS